VFTVSELKILRIQDDNKLENTRGYEIWPQSFLRIEKAYRHSTFEQFLDMSLAITYLISLSKPDRQVVLHPKYIPQGSSAEESNAIQRSTSTSMGKKTFSYIVVLGKSFL